jgi:hypothetical protein
MKYLIPIVIIIQLIGTRCSNYNIQKDSYVKYMEAPIITLDEYRAKVINLIDSISCRGPKNADECIKLCQLYTTSRLYSNQIAFLSSTDKYLMIRKISMIFFEYKAIIDKTLVVLLGHGHSEKYDIYISQPNNSNSFYFVDELEAKKSKKSTFKSKKLFDLN